MTPIVKKESCKIVWPPVDEEEKYPTATPGYYPPATVSATSKAKSANEGSPANFSNLRPDEEAPSAFKPVRANFVDQLNSHVSLIEHPPPFKYFNPLLTKNVTFSEEVNAAEERRCDEQESQWDSPAEGYPLTRQLSLCSQEVLKTMADTKPIEDLTDRLDRRQMIEVISETGRCPSPVPFSPASDVVQTASSFSDAEELTVKRSCAERVPTPLPILDSDEMSDVDESGNNTVMELVSALEKHCKKIPLAPLADALTTAPTRPYTPLQTSLVPIAPEPPVKQPRKLTSSYGFSGQPETEQVFETKSVKELPKPKFETGLMTKAMMIAPPIPYHQLKPSISEPVTIPKPVPLPPETKPYFPPTDNDEVDDEDAPRAYCRSPLKFALMTAPERCYSPLPTVVKPPSPPTEPLPSLDIDYIVKPPSFEKKDEEEEHKSAFVGPLKGKRLVPCVRDPSELKLENKSKEALLFPEQKLGGPQLPHLATELHKPVDIPPYQQHIGEKPYRPSSKSPLPRNRIRAPEINPPPYQSSFTNHDKTKSSYDSSEKVYMNKVGKKPVSPSKISFLNESNIESKVVPTLGYQPKAIGSVPSIVDYDQLVSRLETHITKEAVQKHLKSIDYSATLGPVTAATKFTPGIEESKSSCKINSSSWQTYSSGDGLCPSPLPSTPGYILPSSKQSPPVTENINPLFASLPSASKVEPGTNCLSPAPLPSVQGYISPSLREPVNPNPLFASLPCASRVQPGTNCLSPAPLPSVPGYVSPTPRSTTPHQKTATSLSTHSVQQSQVSHETRYTSVKSSKQEECCQQKSTEECYGTPCSIKQLKPTLQTQSPCMWSGSSREVSHSELSTAKSLSSKLETTMMMNTIKETGRWSPVPPVDPALSQQFPTNLSFTTYETQEPSGYVPPHINKAAVPSFLCKPAPAPPVISFPPTFDPTPVVLEYSRSRSSTPLPTKTYEIKSELPSPAVQKHESFSADETSVSKKSISEVSTFVQNTEEKPLASEPPCQRKYIAEVRSSTTKFDTSFLSKTEETPPGVLPVSMSNPHDETMSGNQSQSVSLPSESSPYYPEFMREKPEPKVFRPEPPPSGSPLLFALTTAPGRSYSPLPSLTKPPTPPPVNSLPDFQTELPVIPGVRPVSMLAALTVASERPYSPMPYYPPAHSVSAKPKEESSVKSNDEKTALKDDTKKSEKTFCSKKGIEITISRDENDVHSDERYVSQKPELKGKQCVKIPRQDSPSRISYTNSGLHKPSTIPPYQQTLGDGTYMPRSRSPQPPHSTNVSEKSSAEAQPSGHSKVTTDSAHSSKSETKQLKSCVKSSQSQSSIDCSKSTCKQTGQICSKKVTISEAASTPPPGGMAPSKPPVCEPSVCQRSVCEPSVCQRSVCEPSVCQPSVCQRSVCEPSVCQRSVCELSVCQRSVCEPSVCQRSVCEPLVCQRSICEPSVCAKRESEATETLAKTCPYFISKAERISSSYTTVENTNQTNVEKQLSSQTASKQVCALSSSQTSEKKVSMSESHSSTIATVCSSSQVKSISTSTGLIQSEPPTVSTSKSTLTDCTRSTKADIGTSTGSSSCSKPRSSEPTQSSLPPVMSSSSISSCPLGKSSQTTSSDLSQSKPSPVTSTKLSHSTSHRLSPLAVSDIPTDGNQTSTFCKTASGAQIFKPPVNPKPTEIKSTGPTETSKKQPSHTVTATAPFTQTTVSQSATSICSTQTQLSSTCKIAPGGKQSKPPVPSSGIKSVPLTEAAAQNPCPITIVTPPSTPTTVSQSPNSAFSLPRKTSASVASSLSRTLSAKIAANNNNSSSQPATVPNTGSASTPNSGAGGTTKGGTAAGLTAPRRGRGVLNPGIGPGARVPLCGQCHEHIRGPFITALGKIWCPDHFICVNEECRRPLQDIGFVEESSGLYCEYCFEKYLAPTCHKCSNKIKGDCLNAIGKHFHPECFKCAFCSKLFGNNPFFLEEGLPYCENDWNELFTTKCFACGFPIEAGDRWVEALNNNYHSPCFNCTMCKKNLEGESFYAKGGRPYCKSHAR